MHEDKPSQTAAWVAAWRGLAPWLPEGGQLAHDPFGLEFAPPVTRPFLAVTARAPWLVRSVLSRGMLAQMVLWLQLRTRALDEYLVRFARGGGRQVVLLGAGFDCRASRFSEDLAGGTVYEIDHPATQRRKREVLNRLGAPSVRTEFLSWNFEREPLSALPGRLRSIGLDPGRPVFTIWEGVIPYLTEPAIAATVAALREWSRAEGSQLAFTYIEPAAMRNSWRQLVAVLGEPWRFGWEPAALPGWMEAHGMRLLVDESDADLGRRLLPPHLVARLGRPGRRVALATPVP
jgi:methyltransferase (TIGR00027 family)